MRFGTLLRKIRIISNYSQKEVAKSVGIVDDAISKIERCERITTPEVVKRLASYYGIDEKFLLNHYYSDLICQYIYDYEGRYDVVDILKTTFSNPKSTPQIPVVKNKKQHKAQKLSETKYGKVKGFNYYIQRNEKLKKRERTSLIRKSAAYFATVQQMEGNKSQISITELDEKMNDVELMEHWNRFYERYGNHFPEFREQIRRERMKRITNKKKVKVKYHSEPYQTPSKMKIDF